MGSLISLWNYKEKISEYIREYSLSSIDEDGFVQKVEAGMAEQMTSEELAKFCSEVAAAMLTQHSDFGKLAAVILMSYHRAVTLDTFCGKMLLIEQNLGILDPEIFEMIVRNREVYDSMVDYARDFDLSYFAIHSLMRSYMIKVDGQCVERPQDVFMRTAIQIHRDDFARVKQTYDLISMGHYTQATPTLFNSCLRSCQLASCFLLNPNSDSIEGIFKTIGDCACISKHAGGLGMSLHEIRCRGSALESTGGVSKGIIPIIKIINETMKYVSPGGTKRQSTIAFYLEPWHKDVFDYLDVRKNTGNEDLRAREIFTAMWVNDLFMERVDRNEEWSLFDPKEAKGLCEVWGEDFRRLYLRYEKTLSRTVVPAQKVFRAIINSQIETGTPYMVYKDTCNRLSNQQNLGTIKCSNLCAEIVEYSSRDETAVCNLSSVCLPKFVVDGEFDFGRLKEVVKVICLNLNRVIDHGFYPTEETRRSNLKHRPIGIGVQGLADTFAKMRLPFDSEQAGTVNRQIFETMYFGALESSVELAMEQGPYESFAGSPLSRGVFHFEMFGAQPSGMWDWEGLRAKVMRYGARNSLLIALMPTAGTSQLFGNSECFEPFTSNIFTRRTVAGEFQVVNTYLMDDLEKLGMWNEEMRNVLIKHEGSVQDIPCIPQAIKDLYKTVWEIKMKSVINMAAERQAFVDQSQSLNIYLGQPTFAKLSSMHFYGWRKGLKTGMYYLRTRPISSAIKFTVDQEMVEKTLSSMHSYGSTGNEQENGGNTVCEACSC